MKIILKQDYENLGKAGEIIDVKPGYARNYLIPQNVGLHATPQNLNLFEHQKKQEEVKQLKHKKDAQAIADKLKKVSITVPVVVGEEDKVFGAVTTQNIADLLQAEGFTIDRRKIQLTEPIKALGVYEVPIKLHSDVEAIIKVWVVKE